MEIWTIQQLSKQLVYQKTSDSLTSSTFTESINNVRTMSIENDRHDMISHFKINLFVMFNANRKFNLYIEQFLCRMTLTLSVSGLEMFL